ncbi:hypothetical protein K8T06_13370, partial [bacterium]|nr:hypothetical protein [bacterium]
ALQVFKQFRVDAIDRSDLETKLRIMLNQPGKSINVTAFLDEIIADDQTDIKIISSRLVDLQTEQEYHTDIAFQLSRDLKDYHLIQGFYSFPEDELSEKQQKLSLANINEQFRKLIINLFENRILVVSNPFLTGDQLVSHITNCLPPYFSIKFMGMQNIKGTGLDFAYRWVSLDKVQTAVSRLDSDNHDTRRKALDFLCEYDDFGIMEGPVATNALKRYRKLVVREFPEIIPQLDEAISRIQRQLDIRLTRIKLESRYQGWRRNFLWFIEQIREAGDSKRRKHQFEQIMEDLFNQRISHVKAKKLLHEIQKRLEGGWMLS